MWLLLLVKSRLVPSGDPLAWRVIHGTQSFLVAVVTRRRHYVSVCGTHRQAIPALRFFLLSCKQHIGCLAQIACRLAKIDGLFVYPGFKIVPIALGTIGNIDKESLWIAFFDLFQLPVKTGIEALFSVFWRCVHLNDVQSLFF